MEDVDRSQAKGNYGIEKSPLLQGASKRWPLGILPAPQPPGLAWSILLVLSGRLFSFLLPLYTVQWTWKLETSLLPGPSCAGEAALVWFFSFQLNRAQPTS